MNSFFTALCLFFYNRDVGQVAALFIVGIGEYLVVWLGTDWDKEVERGIERNRYEAKRRAEIEHLHQESGDGLD